MAQKRFAMNGVELGDDELPVGPTPAPMADALPASVVEALRAGLIQQRAWIQHWRADKACGLPPTDDSLADAEAQITQALERQHAPA
ncbi:hypothetical protein [Chelatococcus reniformis]|uniref:Uncharacterized protein n=1 Tax=Chelatococcus reniformis TaxID=1494448 RepID=A0A916UVL1_9HYPH|nr:hypothetical protein [Chelatococcus reniformis]GGC90666.1 hypothetical protein GCM10010994_55580 [Chelatococcus reniformis]